MCSGQPKKGLAALEMCIRLDPRDPNLAPRLNDMATAFYFCREYEAAIEAAKRAIRSYPNHPLAYRRYLLDVRERNARGSFKTSHYGIQFFYPEHAGPGLGAV